MKDGEQPPCPSPSPYKITSSIFRDISNFKTPKRPSINPSFHSPCPKFFTASKETPRASSSFRRRPSFAPSSNRSKASQRLKAFEIEQSRLAHQVQIKKEQSLRSLAKSLTVWLNFLLERPGSCGCTLSIGNGNEMGVEMSVKGKRDSGPGIGVRVDAAWRSPKRQRDLSWKAVEAGDEENMAKFTNSMYYGLQSSLKDVCNFDDLKQRMEFYLSLSNCKKVFDIMTQVVKNIDEGRLKMKAHCPLLTDVGLREKATKILTGYNPIWLRIGMYIIFGGDSLLSDGDIGSDQGTTFLRMIVEKLFFSHSGMAKSYAYNKKVEGLYRPGYYEALGNIILKRLLLLILVLDRAKCQSKLSLKYGIDGVDGGSPLLFTVQSSIKSSQQVIHDLLSSDIMLGEGNVIAHLAIVGYKVSYQQSPLVEYDFKVTDLFVDLQDGVRLCRAIQLLLNDSSILTKMVVPSDTPKKNLANFDVAFQYLRQAGAALNDEDGVAIMGEDVANGDKELTISLLWNMFVHLQLPLFIKKTMLIEEICKIRGANMDLLKNSSLTSLEMLLSWIQAICQNYDCKVNSFSSLVDGKAVWCLLDYYFRKELCCSYSSKNVCRLNGEESIVLATDYSDAIHNFLLSQKLVTLLGNFPEVLQTSDILEHRGARNERSVIILLVFLASQLIVKKNMDQLNFHKLLGCDCQSLERKYSCAGRFVLSFEADQMKEVVNCKSPEDAAERFKAIKAWWQDMAEKNHKSIPTMQQFSTVKGIDIQQENAAKVIQSHFRRVIERRHFMKMLNATVFLQIIIRAWLDARRKPGFIEFSPVQPRPCEREVLETWRRYVTFIGERYNFLKLKRSILLIQRAARTWITKRHQRKSRKTSNVSALVVVDAATVVQKYIRGCLARMKNANGVAQVANTKEIGANDCQANTEVEVQPSWKNTVVCNSLHDENLAATTIQTCFRCWLLRKRFQNQRQATIKFQCYFRMSKCWKAYQQYKVATMSAIIIQSFVRRWIAQREACRHRHLIITIQRYWRGWLMRREFLSHRMAAIKIQSAIRGLKYRMEFYHKKNIALVIQRFVRGQIIRNKLLGASWSQCGIVAKNSYVFNNSCGDFKCSELNVVVCSVLKLQRWWRCILFLKLRTKSAVIIQSHIRGWIARRRAARETHNIIVIQVRTKSAVIIQSHIRGWIARRRAARETHNIIVVQLRTKSAVIIQSHIRGWIARIKAARERHRIIIVQSFWKGYLARKESRQLQDLRLRMQKSAKNVDDGMRIINRLIAALSELLNMKSVSGILHTCATLDMATEHSQKCCETLVDVGAINTLLKLICSISRSIPDQQVLKHALSTLRNLARYPHLVEVLIDSPKSIEIIFLEFLRNKDEGYFIASELLKKILSCRKGIESVRRSAALLKRLHGLVEDLSRKVYNEKRNARALCAKDYESRLKEASELLKMVIER